MNVKGKDSTNMLSLLEYLTAEENGNQELVKRIAEHIVRALVLERRPDTIQIPNNVVMTKEQVFQMMMQSENAAGYNLAVQELENKIKKIGL